MKFHYNSKNFYLILPIILIVVFLVLRLRSFFRQPVDISLPYTFEVIYFLSAINIFFIIVLYLIMRPTLKMKNNYIINFVSFIHKLFKDLHFILGKKLKAYGIILNKLILFIHSSRLLNHCYIIVFIFIGAPFIIILVTLLFECIVVFKLYFTFKFLPLLLLPISLKIFLLSAISFVDEQLSDLSDELNIIVLDEENNHVQFVFDNCFFSDIKLLGQTLLQISRKKESTSLAHLSTREVYFYYYIFLRYKNELVFIEKICSYYSRWFTILRYMICIFILTYLIYLNIIILW